MEVSLFFWNITLEQKEEEDKFIEKHDIEKSTKDVPVGNNL